VKLFYPRGISKYGFKREESNGMFVGHYSVGFAIKSDENKIPLWILFIAVQFVDILWGTFILLGIEKVRIVPGITATSALDLYYMPYTHSLLGALVWSAFAYGLYRISLESDAARKGAVMVALAVFSHWILDFIVHRPDLPLFDDNFKVGLGLWNFKYLAFALEAAILVGGVLFYLRRNLGISQARKYAILIFVFVMILIQAIGTFVGRPIASYRTVATTNLTLYVVFAVVAFLLERKRGKVT
jgi:membrane-bound metal-dependent hydrolase YbcI (DUF457 family)